MTKKKSQRSKTSKRAKEVPSLVFHLKKDGSPDKRYLSSKYLRKDGSIDKRFKLSSKEIAQSVFITPEGISADTKAGKELIKTFERIPDKVISSVQREKANKLESFSLRPNSRSLIGQVNFFSTEFEFPIFLKYGDDLVPISSGELASLKNAMESRYEEECEENNKTAYPLTWKTIIDPISGSITIDLDKLATPNLSDFDKGFEFLTGDFTWNNE